MTVTFNPFTGTLTTGAAGGQGPAGPQGEPGPMGPEGPAGGTYRHVQGVPDYVWEIAHNLGYYPGGIAVVDSSGEEHHGRVEYLDTNNLRITFLAAGAPAVFSGEAYIS